MYIQWCLWGDILCLGDGGRMAGRCHTVHARAAVAQRYLPIEHVEVEPGEHAFARPSSREGTPSSHHHIQHSKGDEVLLLWNLESQQSVTVAWPY